MRLLEQIESKLLEVMPLVYYGAASNTDEVALWNYIVFFRDSTKRSTNNTSFTDYYTVAIIHENWVPDNLITQVIDNMESIPGVRLANSDIDFNYSRKPSTDAVIEIATLTFLAPRKRV